MEGQNIYHARLMFARPLIDSVDFARQGKDLGGEVGFGELARLGDVLAKSEGILTFKLRGYQDEGRDMLELSLQGVCSLRCQRCLGEMDYPVQILSRLQLLPEDRLDSADEDDVDGIEAKSQLDVMALIEEELLLGMPFAPKHPEGMCAPTANDMQQKASPFTVLARLRQ